MRSGSVRAASSVWSFLLWEEAVVARPPAASEPCSSMRARSRSARLLGRPTTA